MTKFIFDFVKSNAIIIFLLGYSVSSTFYFNFKIEGLKNVNTQLHEKQARTEKELQTERRLRVADGQAYKKLQTQTERIEKRRRESINAIGALSDENKIIIDTVIPDDIKRLLK